jgi:hypothetical protein
VKTVCKKLFPQRSTTMLENIRIASPCSADWEQMRGNDRVRHCGICNLNVYNFSAMTEREIRKLMTRREGLPCVRFYRRRDGTIITRNCPVGVKAVARRISRVAGAIFSFLAAMLSAPPAALAQSYTLSNVSGAGLWVEVRARNGALVPQAKVTLLGTSRNQKIEGVTDKHGRVRLWGSVGGEYSIVVSAPAFRIHDDFVELHAGEVLSAPIVLDVPAPGEVLSTPVAPNVNTAILDIATAGVPMIEPPPRPSHPSRNAITPRPAGPMGGSPGMLR